MEPVPQARGLAVAAALLAVYLIWGSTYLGIRFALEGGWPPLLMAGTRFLVAGSLFYGFLRWRGVPAPTRAQWPTLVAMAVLLLGMGNGMVCIAQQTVDSGLAAVAVASAPLWMALFSMFRGHRPTPVEWTGLAIGFAGVAWAFGSIWSRGRDLPSPFMTAAAQMVVGGCTTCGPRSRAATRTSILRSRCCSVHGWRTSTSAVANWSRWA